ncbi:MAG: NAD(P)(+) transhydrogenase (Re/Si-specific) subunit beta [Planctomycetes bacterium]|nr:NAD(P)(+) transhydrogenase (Re/Si-specific) subunit beta [Planctomycetota bacterium]
MFMLAIMRMGRVKTARSGNFLAAAAMLLAVVSSFVEMGKINPAFIVAGLIIGGAVGAIMAKKVQMTQMPEMVALLNGFGGLASTLVGLATFYALSGGGNLAMMMGRDGGWFGAINLVLTLIVGSVTFTGSIIAFLKLSEKMSGRPILLPMRHVLNVLLLLIPLAMGVAAVWYVNNPILVGLILIGIVLITFVLGVTIVIPIGGGDMPVVISLLNSYSGIAAALAGFTIGEAVLVVSGSLVGASGMILTQIMCKAMNRSLANVMFGGFGAEPAAGGGGGGEYVGVKSADAETAAMIMQDAQNIVIVPGYGMAVAQAQHAVREMAKILEEKGANIRYAVHPVAGRMPGHMNVLLAEANVPYEQLFEMDQINDDFRNVDVVLVIGANDTVNPSAKTDKSSPLYGMPVMNVEEAKTVFTMKRSLGGGFAQVKNTLFECPNNYMVYGDARKTLEEIIKALKEG